MPEVQPEPEPVDAQRVMDTLNLIAGLALSGWLVWELLIPEGWKIEARARVKGLRERYRMARHDVVTEATGVVIDAEAGL